MAEFSLFSLLGMLPELLFIAQIITYLFLAWFLGSLAFRGMRKRIPFAIKVIATIGTGFLCLVAGTVLAKYMFFFEGTVFQIFQLDLFLGGLITSITVAIAFYMITHKDKGEGKDKMINKLQERVSLLEGLLLKHEVPTLREDEVKKTSEALVPGFKAKEADLKKTDWEILLERGERKVKVILSAYTGEVKKIEHLGAKGMLSDPVRIIGIALVIFLVAFSLLNFRGFPSMMEGVASLLGMSPEQFSMFAGSEELPEGCVPVTDLLTEHGISVLGGESAYRNEEVKNMIEGEAGVNIEWMYRIDHEGANYILAVDSGLQNMCSATEDKFCQCIRIPVF